MDYWILSYHFENTRIPYFFAASVVFRIFRPSISHERQLQSLLTIHFLKELNKIFQVHLNTLPKQVNFLLSSAENAKNEPFFIF